MLTQACNAIKHLELNIRCNIIRINVRCKLNRLNWQDYICSVSNHMKLVRRGDNPNKEALMYIPYISCIHSLSKTLTYKLERGLSGYHLLTYWMCWLRVRKSHQRSGDLDLRVGEIPAAELGLWVGKIPLVKSSSQLFLSGKNPISGAVTSIGIWSGVQLIDRLDMSTPRRGNCSSIVAIRLRSHRL